VEFELPKDQVERCDTGDNRDVHLVHGGDLKLSPEMNPRFGKTGEEK